MRISNDVLNVLAESSVEGSRLTLGGQLDRKLYLDTAKVLEAAGAKWNRQAKAHLFDDGVLATERVDEMILTGEVVAAKSEFGAFYTPPDIVARVMDAADIGQGMRVLEPSAGKGALAMAALRAGAGFLHAVEIMPAVAERLAVDLAAFEIPGTVTTGDFLMATPGEPFDRVVMNPPFAKSAAVHHVNHALKFLAPGGRLVAIMPNSVVFRDDRLHAAFRDTVEAGNGRIDALPDDAFRSAGTMVRTVLVTIGGAQ